MILCPVCGVLPDRPMKSSDRTYSVPLNVPWTCLCGRLRAWPQIVGLGMWEFLVRIPMDAGRLFVLHGVLEQHDGSGVVPADLADEIVRDHIGAAVASAVLGS